MVKNHLEIVSQQGKFSMKRYLYIDQSDKYVLWTTRVCVPRGIWVREIWEKKIHYYILPILKFMGLEKCFGAIRL